MSGRRCRMPSARRRAQEQFSDEEVKEQFIVGADLDQHVDRLTEVLQLGPTIVAMLNLSVAAPLEAIRRYGEQVLPALRMHAADCRARPSRLERYP
jgi:hypothetical protein